MFRTRSPEPPQRHQKGAPNTYGRGTPPTHTQGSHCSHVGSSLVYFVPNKTKNHHSKYLRSVLKLKAVWNLQPEHRRRVVRNEGSGHCQAGPAGRASRSALSLQRRSRGAAVQERGGRRGHPGWRHRQREDIPGLPWASDVSIRLLEGRTGSFLESPERSTQGAGGRGRG